LSNTSWWTLLLMVAAGCAHGGGSGSDGVQEVDELGGAGGEAGASSTSSSSSSTSGAGGSGGGDPTSCSDDEELCGGICKDLMTDADHCGGCFQACGSGEDCLAGECSTDPGGTGNAWMCDPLAPEAKCGPGSRCQPRPDGNPVCYSPIGAGSQYDACSVASECDAIHECLQIGTNKFCVQWCLTSADCPNSGDQCFQLAQPIHVGTQAWGICWDGVV